MHMDVDRFIEIMTTSIKPFAKVVAGRSEINCRCFYCSDSDNPIKGHFYIKVPGNDDISYFYCQKCHAHGVVTQAKLMEWGIYDSQFGLELTQYNAKVLKLAKNQRFISSISSVFNVKNTKITIDKLTEYKLKYINKRIGTNLTYDDCIKNKIILNLSDFITENKLELTRHENIVEQLDSNFVGFLSYDNAFINMRNLQLKNAKLYENIDKRYINYNVFNKFDNTLKFYIPPVQLDLRDPSPIHIRLAEGPFDILSIKYNIVGEGGRDIFGAVGGSSYKSCLRFLLLNTGFPNFIVHLYMDTDQLNKTRSINEIKNTLYKFGIPMYIHNNSYPGEKDFGVTPDKIRESIRQY